jgi:hypothetical protein
LKGVSTGDKMNNEKQEDVKTQETKKDRKGKNARASAKIGDIFFAEKPIFINLEDIEGEDSFYVFMRPLKVKEIPILNRITYLQTINPEDEQAGIMLMNLMVDCLNVTSEEIPASATSGLIQHLIKYNFPKKDESKNTSENKKKNKNKLVNCFDFLITNGHTESDIMEYPINRFDDYINVVATRLGIKKEPVSAEVALKKIGLPFRSRGKKKE